MPGKNYQFHENGPYFKEYSDHFPKTVQKINDYISAQGSFAPMNLNDPEHDLDREMYLESLEIRFIPIINMVFEEELNQNESTSSYSAYCSVDIYKCHFKNRLEHFLIKFPDGNDLDFVEEELERLSNKGITGFTNPEIQKRTDYSRKRKVEFLKSKIPFDDTESVTDNERPDKQRAFPAYCEFGSLIARADITLSHGQLFYKGKPIGNASEAAKYLNDNVLSKKAEIRQYIGATFFGHKTTSKHMLQNLNLIRNTIGYCDAKGIEVDQSFREKLKEEEDLH